MQEIGRGIGRRVVRAAATGAAAGLVVMGAAACEPAPAPQRPFPPMPTIIPTPTTTPVPAPTELKVVYRDGGGGSRTYTVRCGPGTAASVTPAVAGLDAGRACAVTTSERTLLVDGPVPQICAQVYLGPQSATVTGHIDDDPVDLRFGRNTPCRDNDWRRVGALVLRPSGSGRAG